MTIVYLNNLKLNILYALHNSSTNLIYFLFNYSRFRRSSAGRETPQSDVEEPVRRGGGAALAAEDGQCGSSVEGRLTALPCGDSAYQEVNPRIQRPASDVHLHQHP